MPARRVRFVYTDDEHHDRPVEVGPEGYHRLREDPDCTVELVEGQDTYEEWLEEAGAGVAEAPSADGAPAPSSGYTAEHTGGGWYAVYDAEGEQVDTVRGKEGAHERIEELEADQ